MGKKKAKKRSKLLDSGRDSVNIEIKNGKLKKKKKKDRLYIVLCLLFTVNIVLMHLIFIYTKKYTTLMKKIDEMALKQEELFSTLPATGKLRRKIVIDLFDKYSI